MFLKAKVPAWRYQRGQRSLAENLAPELVDQVSVVLHCVCLLVCLLVMSACLLFDC